MVDEQQLQVSDDRGAANRSVRDVSRWRPRLDNQFYDVLVPAFVQCTLVHFARTFTDRNGSETNIPE